MEVDEPAPRRPGDLLKALAAEDLDRLSVADLDARLLALATEMERTRAKRQSSAAFRAAADSLFRKD